MATATRIYTVVNATTGEKYLTEATSQSAAIKLIVGPNFTAEVTAAADLAHLMESGLKVVRSTTPATTEE